MAGTELIDRSTEVARVEAFVAAPVAGVSALELAGAPGIGKTSLWTHGRRVAEANGFTVLWARPTEAAARSSFGAIADLLFPVGEEQLHALPAPQRDALEVALLRRASPRRGAAPRAVASGLLSVVRRLTSSGPLLIAVDDWQWLDRPSRDALAFVARRLEFEPVRILYSLRTPAASGGLGDAVIGERFTRITLAGLGLPAIGRLVSDRLGRGLPRPLLVRISQTTAGNPFHVLELAQALDEHGATVAAGEELPVPENLRELLLGRVAQLPRSTREALSLVAALSRPTTALVCAEQLVPAERAAIVDVAPGGLIRFRHPLFAAAVQGALTSAERRRIQARAAELATDPEQRARHLALAATGPDEVVAGHLDQAAALAEIRGAPDAAAELLELAALLSPGDEPGRTADRLIRAASLLLNVGDLERADRLLRDALRLEIPDHLRARGIQISAQLAGHRNHWPAAAELADAARLLAHDQPQLLAGIEFDLAFAWVSIGDIAMALRHARGAVEHAAAIGDDGIRAVALAVVTMVTFLGGGGVAREQLELALALEDPRRVDAPMMRPSFIAGLLELWTGEPARAALTLTTLHRELLERGQEGAAPFVSFFVVWAYLWSGDFPAATRAALQAEDAAGLLDDPAVRAMARTATALTQAHLGESAHAISSAQDALAVFTELGWASACVWPSWALGLAALADSQHERVHSLLGPLAEQVAAMGAGDPVIGMFVPDDIEALIALGDDATASKLLAWFEGRADALGNDWALALAARSRGALAAHAGDIDAAIAAFATAMAAHERCPIDFERARTLLLAGRCLRRAKRRRAAVEGLSEALEIFNTLGAHGWAARAQAELVRVGGRTAVADALTAGERVIAELAASGLSNREVAERAFISVKTVEANLTRVYRKLGVRSRVELANALRT